MANTPIEFDKKKVFEKEIQKHLDTIADLCIRNHIPFFFAACTANKIDENGEYKPEYVVKARHASTFGFMIPKDDLVGLNYEVWRGAKVSVVPDVTIEFSGLSTPDSTDF